MKYSNLLLNAVVAATLTGCAHGAMRGTVAMKTSDSEAHVCLGEGDVKPGDRVTLYRNVCATKGSPRAVGGRNIPVGTCERLELGKGTVEQAINKHYSLVKFDSGVTFEEGTFVEKQ